MATGVVCADVEPREESLVEYAAGACAGELVKLVGDSQEVENRVQRHASGVEFAVFDVIELAFWAGLLAADFAGFVRRVFLRASRGRR